MLYYSQCTTHDTLMELVARVCMYTGTSLQTCIQNKTEQIIPHDVTPPKYKWSWLHPKTLPSFARDIDDYRV